MTWVGAAGLLAILLGAKPVQDACVWIDTDVVAFEAEVIPRDKFIFGANVVPGDESVVFVWTVDVRRYIKTWDEPFELGTPMLSLGGVEREFLSGQRAIVRTGSWSGSPRGEEEILGLIDYRTPDVPRKLFESTKLSEIVAVACGVPARAAARLDERDLTACVGGQLIAVQWRSVAYAVLVWRSDGWAETGVRFERRPSFMDTRSSFSRILLPREEYSRNRKALEMAGILSAPLPTTDLEAWACGDAACWALTPAGEVLVLDAGASRPVWSLAAKVLVGGQPQFAAWNRAIAYSDACHRVYKLRLRVSSKGESERAKQDNATKVDGGPGR